MISENGLLYKLKKEKRNNFNWASFVKNWRSISSPEVPSMGTDLIVCIKKNTKEQID